MNTPATGSALRHRLAAWVSPEALRQGGQTVLALLLAWGASQLLRWPEPMWAVMTVLIVMRGDASATLNAALGRLGSTVLGASCGLVGVWLQGQGGPAGFIGLLVMLPLAYAGAAQPALRGGAIAALIVLSAAAVAGASAMAVAVLRLGQVFLGAGAALLVVWLSYRHDAGARVRARCAALLRDAAAGLPAPGAAAEPSPQQPSTLATRRAVGAVLALAASADGPSWRRARPRVHQQLAGLTALMLQDVAALQRAARLAPLPAAVVGQAWEPARRMLLEAADRLQPAAVGEKSSPLDSVPEGLLATPLLLLRADLGQLRRCLQAAGLGSG